MGEYRELELPEATRCRTHRRTRTYEARIATTDRGKLRRFVETVTTDRWVVTEVEHGNGWTRVELMYGPVQGNWPADAARLLDGAGVTVIESPKAIGRPVHVTDGSCTHHLHGLDRGRGTQLDPVPGSVRNTRAVLAATERDGCRDRRRDRPARLN